MSYEKRNFLLEIKAEIAVLNFRVRAIPIARSSENATAVARTCREKGADDAEQSEGGGYLYRRTRPKGLL